MSTAVGLAADTAVPGSAKFAQSLASMGFKGVANRVSKLVGSGDYSMSVPEHNSLMKGEVPGGASFGSSQDSIRVKRREYIGDLRAGASNTFTNSIFSVNAENFRTFPFLSQVAINYEKYFVHGLTMEYVPMVSNYNATPNMGIVCIAAQMNPTEAPWTSKIQVESAEGAISTRPDKGIIFGVECKGQNLNGLFVASSQDSTPANLTTLANIYASVLNTGAYAQGSVLGELWISYDVTFKACRLNPNPPGYYHVTGSATSGTVGYGTAGNNVVEQWGACATVYAGTPSPDGCVIYFNDMPIGTVFTGTYLFSSPDASATCTVGWALSGLNGLTPLSNIGSDTTNNYTLKSGTTAAANTLGAVQFQYYSINQSSTNPNGSASITIKFPTVSASCSWQYDIIFQVVGLNSTTNTI